MASELNYSLSQTQSQKMAQVQSMKMSQQQIMSLKVLAMSSADLREEIYRQSESNPALEIIDDSSETSIRTAAKKNSLSLSDNIHAGTSSLSGEIASDNFLAALENSEDYRETLQEHLEHQLNSMNLPEKQSEFCTKLIRNLDSNGFFILSPFSLLDKKDSAQDENFAENCMSIVQNLDPAGTCTKNFEESLLVQAKINGGDRCSLFLLEHFDFLDPPQTGKIQKKIKKFNDEQEKLIFRTSDDSENTVDFSDDEIQSALSFIKTLDPFPARNFGTEQARFIKSDIKIEVGDDDDEISVSVDDENLPVISVSENYKTFIEEKKGNSSEKVKAEIEFAKESLQKAQSFINFVEQRRATLSKAAVEIALWQKKFFRKGPRYLVPFRQKDLAAIIGVHEATVSRLANEKFVSCKWGIFPVSYFFSNEIESTTSLTEKKSDGTDSFSKESVKFEIRQILEEHKNDRKAPSDQKISDMLAEKGIKLARRTVAKYRAELNLGSSYER